MNWGRRWKRAEQVPKKFVNNDEDRKLQMIIRMVAGIAGSSGMKAMPPLGVVAGDLTFWGRRGGKYDDDEEEEDDDVMG